MFYMSENEFRNKMRKQRLKNQSIARKQELLKEKNRYKEPKKSLSTSKMILWAIIALIFEIVVFVEVVMWKWGDFSAVYALIGIPATLIPVVWAYYSKSKAENTAGGITYDMAMKDYGIDENAVG